MVVFLGPVVALGVVVGLGPVVGVLDETLGVVEGKGPVVGVLDEVPTLEFDEFGNQIQFSNQQSELHPSPEVIFQSSHSSP